MSLTSSPKSVQAVFALQVVVAVLAFLVFLITTSLAAILFLRRRTRHSQGKTSPRGTFAFLSIGVLCLAIAQAATAASVAQQTNTSSPASITHAFSLYYRGSSSNSPGETSTTSVNLSFLNAFAFIISTVCLNGAVWLHASHATSNGLAVGQPSRIDIIGNAILLLLMTATGFASWGLGVSSYTANQRYGNVLQDDLPSRAVYTVFRACVVVSTVSVAVESIQRYVQTKNHSSRNVSATTLRTNPSTSPLTKDFQASQRPILSRLALLAVPILILRSIFIVLDIALLWVADTYPTWSITTQEAISFLLIIFGPYAEVWVFAIVCLGGWQMSRLSKGQMGDYGMVM
ncbi:hypothetical protein Q7P35_001941 [Cladosporium inversicolor]